MQRVYLKTSSEVNVYFDGLSGRTGVDKSRLMHLVLERYMNQANGGDITSDALTLYEILERKEIGDK